MKHFSDVGFSEVYGVENSKMRADRVHEAFGFTVYHGDFGSLDISEKLKKHAPYSLVFSHHVLEHTYHPAEVIHEISKLQNEGDHLILALPNCNYEHILYQVLYLPHLHGFTPESLEIILNANGYELLVDNRDHETSIIIAAVKKNNPVKKLARASDYVGQVEGRLRKALAIDSVPQGQIYEVKWEQKAENTDFSVHRQASTSAAFESLVWRMRRVYWFVKTRILKRFSAAYYMRLIANGESTQNEIVYSNGIQVMVK
jgi:hypothetical protein